MTPGLLTAVAAVLALLGISSGVVGVLSVQRRAALVHDVGDFSGPLSVRAQDIYRSLSDADATAANAFLANGVEPAALRQRYLDDIARAGAALAAALRDADDQGAAELGVLSAQVPVYTGLVETARAYNRQGVPLGGAYLREASGLMRQTILPAAHRLFQIEADRLAAAQRDAARFPWAALLVTSAALVALVAAQVYLTRRTNRLINVGLAVASLAAVAALGWSGLALTGAGAHVNDGRRDGSAQVEVLAEARVAALQARADEALTLIARGDGATFEKDYVAATQALVGADGSGGLLGRALAGAPSEGDRVLIGEAVTRAQEWLSVHKRLRELDDGGQYLQAVRLAGQSDPQGSAAAFARLEEALAQGIAATNDRFDASADRAEGALRGADIALIALTLVLLAGAVLGLQRRIGEYR
jgi:hypothetical protein